MSNLVIFEHNGEQVVFDAASQMWNITAMHQASGAPANKTPRDWLRGAQAQELIEALAAKLNQSDSHIYRAEDLVLTRRGRYDGGTWVHWQLAATYAHYLSARFYLQWNDWAMERQMQLTGDAQESAPLSFSERDRLMALELRVAALEARGTASAKRLPSPRRPLGPVTLEMVAAIQALGGRATVGELVAHFAAVPPATVHIRLWCMTMRGDLLRVGYATYEVAAR